MFSFSEVIQHLEYESICGFHIWNMKLVLRDHSTSEKGTRFLNHLEPWHIVSNKYVWVLW